MIKSLRRRIAPALVLIPLVYLLVVVLLLLQQSLRYEERIEQAKTTQLDSIERLTRSFEHQQKRVADGYFQQLISDPSVAELLEQAEQTADSRREVVRQLRGLVMPSLNKMQLAGLNSYRFYSSEGELLTQVDDLAKPQQQPVRVPAPVLQVMVSQEPLHGYQRAGGLSGYFYFYPVFKETTLVGVVEFGMSLDVLTEQLVQVHTNADIYVLYNRWRLPDDELDGLKEVGGLPQHLMDQQASRGVQSSLEGFVGPESDRIRQALRLGEVAVFNNKEKRHTLALVPLENSRGRYTAMLAVLIRDYWSDNLRNDYFKELLLVLWIASVFFAFGIWMWLQRQRSREVARNLELALRGGALGTCEFIPHTGMVWLRSEGLACLNIAWSVPEHMNWRDLRAYVHPDDWHALVRSMVNYLRNGSQGQHMVEFRIRDDHGQWIWLRCAGQLVQRQHDVYSRYAAVLRDITVQHHIQQRLEASEAKYRQLFRQNKAVELIVDADTGDIADANTAACQYYGYSYQQLCRMNIMEINTLTPAEVRQEMQRAVEEDRSHFYFRHRLASGEIRDVEVRSGPIQLDGNHQYLYSIIHDVTDRMEAEQALKISEMRLSSLFEASLDGLLVVSDDAEVELCNPAAGRILGYEPEQLEGTRLPRVLLPRENRLRHFRNIRRYLETGEADFLNQVIELEIIRRDGERRWIELALAPMQLGLRVLFVGSFRDITERREQANELRLAHIAFETSLEGIVVTDADNRIVSINPAVEAITGYMEDELVGKCPSVFSGGKQPPEFYQAMWAQLHATGHWQGEVINRHKDGYNYAEWLSISCLRDTEGRVQNYVAVFSDISDIKASQERLDYLAHHDNLTGLPNRLSLRTELEQAVFHASRTNRQLALMFIDLDRFKQVNDTLGHDVGDELLQEVAGVLNESVRDMDLVARLGGDEFCIMFRNFSDLQRLEERAHTLVRRLNQPMLVPSGHELRIGASVGISLYPQDANDVSSLIKHADTAMYRAKEAGKGRYEFYNPEMSSHTLGRYRMEQALHQALAHGDLQVFYQPQLELRTGRVTGIEALARWHHKEMGFIRPDVFIELAEESGCIFELGSQMMQIAMRDYSWLRERGVAPDYLAINASAPELEHEDYMAQLAARLDEFQMAGQLELEVTETSLASEPEEFVERLHKIRQQGIRIAIDDFGTGHSSLMRLRKCPIDSLKIDRVFISDLPDDQDDLMITRSVLSLAHSLGMEVVAEGVETAVQAQLLQQLGCESAQGYFYARPMPLNELYIWLKEHDAKAAIELLEHSD